MIYIYILLIFACQPQDEIDLHRFLIHTLIQLCYMLDSIMILLAIIKSILCNLYY